MFWKFTNGTAENQDGGEEQQASSRLLFTRGYAVFNAAQVDGYTPKASGHTPIEERMERAEVFFKGVSARVVHQGNRAFYSPVEDTITLPPFAAFFTPVDYYSTEAVSSTQCISMHIGGRELACLGRGGSGVQIAPPRPNVLLIL